MTKQIFAFLFCFTRELNPHSPLISILPPTPPPIPHTLTPQGARTQNPHPPRALSLWLNRVARRSEQALAFKDSTNPLPPPYPHPPPTHGVKI